MKRIELKRFKKTTNNKQRKKQKQKRRRKKRNETKRKPQKEEEEGRRRRREGRRETENETKTKEEEEETKRKTKETREKGRICASYFPRDSPNSMLSISGLSRLFPIFNRAGGETASPLLLTRVKNLLSRNKKPTFSFF